MTSPSPSEADRFARLAGRPGPIRVAMLGECMIELSDLDADDGRLATGVAGDTLNWAIYTKRASGQQAGGPVMSVDYLTALGRDQLSDRMIRAMQVEGIGTAHVVRFEDKLPGLYAIELDGAGERSFRYWRSQSAAKSMLEDGGLSAETLAGFDVLALSAISLAILPDASREALIAICAAAKQSGHVVAFDSNYRPALWTGPDEARRWIDAMWAVTTLALPSRDDEAKLHPSEAPHALFDRLASAGVEEIVLKDGAGGPLLWHGTPLAKDTYPPATRVVDTTSAGDSFNAGYVASRLGGFDPHGAAKRAHLLACAVIGEKGAIIPMAAMPDLEAG